MDREAIYSALFAKLRTAAVFQTASRRLKHWSDVSPADQPALFQSQRRETANTLPGLNTIWELRVDVYLYARAPDQENPPAQILNPLLDALAATLAPDPITNKQRLGGLVEHVWIEGEIETDEGVLGDQGVCIVPLVLKVSS